MAKVMIYVEPNWLTSEIELPTTIGTTQQVLRGDGTWGASGGGSSPTLGEATIDFGAFPGKSDTFVNVVGQSAIVSGSKVTAWLAPKATADHTVDEHLMETIRIMAGNIVPTVGFTIYALNYSQLNEPLELRSGRGGLGTRIYGSWTVQWQWI